MHSILRYESYDIIEICWLKCIGTMFAQYNNKAWNIKFSTLDRGVAAAACIEPWRGTI